VIGSRSLIAQPFFGVPITWVLPLAHRAARFPLRLPKTSRGSVRSPPARAWPSTTAVHAPMPQPYFVPVRFGWSRSSQSTGVAGSTSSSTRGPFRWRKIVAAVRASAPLRRPLRL